MQILADCSLNSLQCRPFRYRHLFRFVWVIQHFLLLVQLTHLAISRILDRVTSAEDFISLSYMVRIVEALGNAAFLTASFALVAAEFPRSVATTFVSIFIITVYWREGLAGEKMWEESDKTLFKGKKWIDICFQLSIRRLKINLVSCISFVRLPCVRVRVSGSPYSVLSLRGLLQMPPILTLNSVWLIFRFV